MMSLHTVDKGEVSFSFRGQLLLEWRKELYPYFSMFLNFSRIKLFSIIKQKERGDRKEILLRMKNGYTFENKLVDRI